MSGFYCIVDVFRMVLFNRSCNWRTLPGPCGERKKLSLNHVHAMPSRIEGLPLVLIEAMLCGRPVVATDVAGAEVIEDEVTGFLAGAVNAGEKMPQRAGVKLHHGWMPKCPHGRAFATRQTG